MTTPAEIIPSAARRAGALGSVEIMSAEDMATAFSVLNEMIDAWSIESLFLYQMVTVQTVAIAGKAQYTAGPGGDFNSSRPTSINSLIYSNGSIDYTVEQTTVDQYDQVPYKSISGIPSAFAYEPAMPLGVLSIYPIPIAGGTLSLQTGQLLTQFTSTGQNVVFPPGYLAALRQSLAVALCAEFQVPASADLMRASALAKRAIKRMNSRVSVLNIPGNSASTRNILSGFN